MTELSGMSAEERSAYSQGHSDARQCLLHQDARSRIGASGRDLLLGAMICLFAVLMYVDVGHFRAAYGDHTRAFTDQLTGSVNDIWSDLPSVVQAQIYETANISSDVFSWSAHRALSLPHSLARAYQIFIPVSTIGWVHILLGVLFVLIAAYILAPFSGSQGGATVRDDRGVATRAPLDSAALDISGRRSTPVANSAKYRGRSDISRSAAFCLVAMCAASVTFVVSFVVTVVLIS